MGELHGHGCSFICFNYQERRWSYLKMNGGISVWYDYAVTAISTSVYSIMALSKRRLLLVSESVGVSE